MTLYMTTGILIFIHIGACVIDQIYMEETVLKIFIECLADYNANAIMPLVISISMFLLFKRIEIKKGKQLICKVGAATLGVYLFHDNANFKMMLWGTCKLFLETKSKLFIIESVICVITIFVLGTVIEVLRGFMAQVFFMKKEKTC